MKISLANRFINQTIQSKAYHVTPPPVDAKKVITTAYIMWAFILMERFFMKLHLTDFSNLNAFTGYGPGYVEVNRTQYTCNLIVLPDQIIQNWQVRNIDELTMQHLEVLLGMQPEIILIGTGATFRFPDKSLLKNIAIRAISLEVMDTQATCRTYNILSTEGRRVAAAMFIENTNSQLSSLHVST